MPPRPAPTPSTCDSLARVHDEIVACRACPRLVVWREESAANPPARYASQDYWARPIPHFGDPNAQVLVVGLAPAAHGGNRTGRVFTGDRSGDWLFASLHRVGLATRPTSTRADDGQQLVDTRMVATVRCAPPQNKPTTAEIATCAPWIEAELALLVEHVRVVVALGGIGWTATLRTFEAIGFPIPRPRPRFGHGAAVELSGPSGSVTLLGCYHPSQQNTFTGRLTEPMLDDVLGRAAALR